MYPSPSRTFVMVTGYHGKPARTVL
jgi:hypothetical protein